MDWTPFENFSSQLLQFRELIASERNHGPSPLFLYDKELTLKVQYVSLAFKGVKMI